MKILHLINSAGMYGAERVVLTLARHLDAASFEVTVSAFQDIRDPHLELLEAAGHAGLSTEPIPCRGRFDWGAVRKVRETLLRRGIQLLHCHGFKADIYGLIASKWIGIPAVATHHGWTHGRTLIRLYERLDAVALRFFSRVVAVSESASHEMGRLEVPRERLRIIYNGIDLSMVQRNSSAASRTKWGIPPDDQVVGIVGRLSPEKGHGVFLDAAQRVLARRPHTTFLIVGEGELRVALASRARSLGIERSVRFLGFQQDMAQIYSALDLLVSSSFREGTPMVLLEAMAAGVPVIATSVGGVPELVGSQGATLLVAPGDPAPFATAICDLLAHPEKRSALTMSARQRVEDRFSAERMGKLYGQLYLELAM